MLHVDKYAAIIKDLRLSVEGPIRIAVDGEDGWRLNEAGRGSHQDPNSAARCCEVLRGAAASAAVRCKGSHPDQLSATENALGENPRLHSIPRPPMTPRLPTPPDSDLFFAFPFLSFKRLLLPFFHPQAHSHRCVLPYHYLNFGA